MSGVRSSWDTAATKWSFDGQRPDEVGDVARRPAPRRRIPAVAADERPTRSSARWVTGSVADPDDQVVELLPAAARADGSLVRLEPPPSSAKMSPGLAGLRLGAVRVGQLDVLLVTAVHDEIAAVGVQDRSIPMSTESRRASRWRRCRSRAPRGLGQPLGELGRLGTSRIWEMKWIGAPVRRRGAGPPRGHRARCARRRGGSACAAGTTILARQGLLDQAPGRSARSSGWVICWKVIVRISRSVVAEHVAQRLVGAEQPPVGGDQRRTHRGVFDGQLPQQLARRPLPCTVTSSTSLAG